MSASRKVDIMQDGAKVAKLETATDAEIYEDPQGSPVPRTKEESLALLELRAGTAIVDQATLDSANGLLKEVKAFQKAVAEEYRPQIAKWHDGWKAEIAREKRWSEPLEKLERELKRRIADFLVEQDRVRFEAERKAELARRQEEAVAWKTNDAAHQAIQEGRLDDVDRIVGEGAARIEAIQKAAPAPPPKVAAAGSTVRQVWDFEVVDFAAVPDKYKVLNEALVRDMCQKLHDQAAIPGIRPFYRNVLSVRMSG